MYLDGDGIPKDERQAASWFQRAAAQGDAMAQNSLAAMYADGQGVAQDYKQAVSWFQEAAKQYPEAQYNLAVSYAQGRGVVQDYVEAHKWFNLAGANGIENARKNRDLLEKQMSREQIAEAQRRASDWLKAQGK
jgi:uncharacterized protein